MIGKELGNYHVLEMIGKGGMAIVYKGRHKTLSRRIVAIKMLSASLEGDASFSERFFREAEVMDQLRHPNIVTLYDFIEENGHYFIVMEYVAGKTLSEIIKEAGGPLSYAEIRAVFQQVLAGIGHAHQLGIVHRDMKPGNIMINEEGEAKITDFGIARLLGNNFEATLTTTGVGIGSPYYMSPEQVLASKEHPITEASDIYSLGITLYQAATGKLPFEGADSLFTIMQSHVKKSPPPPREIVPGIPEPLENVILKAIEKKPEDRWSSCEAFWESLAGALVEPSLTGAATETMRTAPMESPPPIQTEPEEAKKKNLTALVVGILILVTVLAGAGTFFFLRHRTRTKSPAPTVTQEKTAQSASSGSEVTAETKEANAVPAENQPAEEKTIPTGGTEKPGRQAAAPAQKEPPKEETEQKAMQAQQAAKEQAKKQEHQKEIDRMVKQAGVFMGLKEYSKAQDIALKVLERDPGNAKARKIYAQAKEKKRRIIADRKIAQAEAAFAAKKYRLAVKETRAVLKMYPKDPRALALKGKLEELARRVLERRQRIQAALQRAEAALEAKQFTKAKLIAQQVLDVEPENKRAQRVVELADEGQENKMLQDMVKGFLPSGGGGGMPANPQGVPDESGGDQMPTIPQGLPDQSGGQMPSLPLPGLPQQ